MLRNPYAVTLIACFACFSIRKHLVGPHKIRAFYLKTGFVVCLLFSSKAFSANSFREKITSCGLRLKLTLAKFGLYTPKDMNQFFRACFYGEKCDALTGHTISISENPLATKDGTIHNQYLGAFTQSIIDRKKIPDEFKRVVDHVQEKSLEGPKAFKEYSTLLLLFEDGTSQSIDAHSDAGDLIFNDDIYASLNAEKHNFEKKPIKSIVHIHSHPGAEYLKAMGLDSDREKSTGIINSIDYQFYLTLSKYFSDIYKKQMPVVGVVVPIGKHLENALYVTGAIHEEN